MSQEAAAREKDEEFDDQPERIVDVFKPNFKIYLNKAQQCEFDPFDQETIPRNPSIDTVDENNTDIDQNQIQSKISNEEEKACALANTDNSIFSSLIKLRNIHERKLV